MKYFEKNGVRFNYDIIVNSSDNLQVKQETVNFENGFKTRLCITNKCIYDVLVENAYPLCINDLSIGDVPSGEWVILNHGRHKNDLPSVCRAGIRDEAFSDAVNRLSEEGRIVEEKYDGATELNGDQIAVIRGGESSLAISFFTNDIQFTEIVIPIDKDGNIGTIRAGGDLNCLLPAGKKIYTDWVCVDCQPDSFGAIDDYARMVKESKGVNVPDQKPGVYSTWYYYGKEVTAEDVYININGVVDKGLPFTHFQIDDGWQVMYGDWEANEKFPQGMTKIAEDIKSSGMEPGIWSCPLIADKNSQLFKEHPYWFLRYPDGEYCTFMVNKQESLVLDCTNPKVIEWIEQLYCKLRLWGYTYHKLDFTRAFPIQRDVVYYNSFITPVEAYTEAMKAVRRGIGDDGYLLICGGLYQPLVGIADGQRTGSDVKSMWFNDDGIPKIPFTVKQNVLRYFMNEWWHNDPDSLMVRRDDKGHIVKHLSLGLLSDDEAVTFTANQYFGGGLIGSTEALDKISDDRLYLLKHIMPVVPTKVKPVDMMTGERFVSVIDVWVEKGWHTVCFVNWSDEPKEIEFVVDEKYAEKGRKYYVSAFFRKTVTKNAEVGTKVKIGTLNPHSTEIVKIAPSDVTQIIKSDCHFSMGGEVDLMVENNKIVFKTKNPYPVEMHYTVATPNGREFVITVPGKSEFCKIL